MTSPTVKQFIVAFSLWCQQFHCGFMYGVISILLPALRKPESSYHLTSDQESWIASTSLLVTFPTMTIAGILTSIYGRKIIIYIAVVNHIISAMLVYFSHNFITLNLGMIFFGLSSAAGAVGSLYISECCSPRLRGMMLDAKFASTHLGVAVSRLSGSFCHWKTIILIGLIPIFILFVIWIFSPESPAWLASQGRFDECQRSFNFFRPSKELDELNKLVEWQRHVIDKKSSKNDQSANRIHSVITKFVKTILHKGFLKASLITLVCMLIFDFGGKLLLVFYINVINEITKDPANRDYYNFCIDISDLIVTCISSVLVTKFPRRKLLFGIGAPALIFLYIFCYVSYLSSSNKLGERLTWLPFAIFLVYFLLINSSVIPITFTTPGEIYPLSHRGLSIIVRSFIYSVSTFVLIKTAPTSLMNYGVHGTFLIFAIGSTLSIVVLYFILPETFKKSLQTIEQNLTGDEKEKFDAEVNSSMINN